ncbi:hypothetical protein Ancab_011274 [Ancistrocladus abbreviatus]
MEDTRKAHDEHAGSGDHYHVIDEDDIELDGDEELPRFELEPSHEAKLRELLRNISSIEIKLCSDGSKEFMKLLRGGSGGELLHQYVSTSSNLTELLEAWSLRRGKQGLSYILSLISVILDHPEGKYRPNVTGRISVSRVLDRFAKKIIEEKMDDVYRELNSNEGKRQKAALLLMGAIVRRGSGLAAEVAKTFDFKLPIFPKLAEFTQRKGVQWKRKRLTRGAFIEFAMSFLEVGKPGLLRWVLQQREMFSGILRGLGDDEDETVVYVLSTLRDRVLIPESLVPPGLRSVLFGSVTLEQLASISARENGSLVAEIAHNVLIMVCTDPSNGLMPDLKRQPPLRGNLKRLMDLMKKLKATEIKHHRNLLLSIVSGRPSFGSAYLDEFPYNLEDHASPNWFSAVSLAANLVSSVSTGISWDFLNSQSHDPVIFHGSDVQTVLKCVCPRPFNRLVINKGLLHSDPLVKHGTLKLLLENLKLLDSFIDSVSMHGLTSLKQEIQSEVRVLLPDPQVLFALLNSLSSNYNSQRTSLKRVAGSEIAAKMNKKLKADTVDKDIDIVIGGIKSISGAVLLQESDNIREAFTTNEDDVEKDHVKTTEIWGLHQCSVLDDVGNDAEVYFHSKVLDVFRIYHRTLYSVLDVSYDLFKILPSNPLALPSTLLQSLLSLLIEHVRQSSKSECGSLPSFHKYLQPFINLLLYSSIGEIKDKAYILARAAMLSTGAFDSAPQEVEAWFLFLPGYERHNAHVGVQEPELLLNLSPAIVSFLCDAVSTTGNNLIKYWDLVKCHLHQPNDWKDMVVHFSPLVICILEKCLRLLNAESGTFTLGEKTMISLYVSSTLKYVLQTQVEAKLLSSLIYQFLSERVEDPFVAADTESISCEWRPLKYLLLFSQSMSRQETHASVDINAVSSSSSFASALVEVKKILMSGHSSELNGVAKAFYFCLICSSPSAIIENFTSVMEISQMLVGIHPLLASLFFLDRSLLDRVCKLWPDIFASGLEMSACGMSSELNQSDDNPQQSCFSSSPIHSNLNSNVTHSAFGSFLKQAPFYLLFPAIAICGYQTDYQKYHTRIKEMLLGKLYRLTTHQLISCLRLVLFWIHQIQLSYSHESTEKLENFSELSYTLVEHILSQIRLVKADSSYSIIMDVSPSIRCGEEIAETIFNHPAVVSSLSCPLGYGDELTVEFLRDRVDGVLCLSRKQVCKTDHQILVLLTTVSDYLLGLCSSQKSVTVNNGCTNKIVKRFNLLVEQLFKVFKEGFEQCVGSQDLKLVLPALYAILALIRFISPFDLLELVHWMFYKADLEDSMPCDKVSPISLGCCIAAGAFEMLSKYFLMSDTGGAPSYLFWGSKGESFDVKLFESVYFKAFKFSTRLNLDIADICLLKAVSAAARCKYRQDLLPLSMGMARVIAGTPFEILPYCVHKTDRIKAKLLFLLIEMSPLHVSVFGRVFSDILKKAILMKDNAIEDTCKFYLSDVEYLLLLPAALSYLNLARPKYGNLGFKKIEYIPSFYSRILMDGFFNWKSFVSQTIFQVECDDVRPSTTEQLSELISNSLLAKGVHMLQCHLALSGVMMADRVKLFLSLCPCPGVVEEIFDLSVREVCSASVDQLLTLVNRVFTKIWLCRILIFPEDGESQIFLKRAHDDEDHPVSACDGEDSLRIRFLDMLVSTWQLIVNKFPYESDCSDRKNDGFVLFKLLEVFILRCISEVIKKMRDALVQLDTLPFLEKLARFSFLHRFGDPTTLEIFRSILSSLSVGNSPILLFLQLLLGHSQLAPTIQIVAGSSPSNAAGMFLRPISSILSCQVIPTESSGTGKSAVNMSQLEVIKLLRVLFHLSRQHSSSLDNNMDIRELLFLLLSSYGATLSEIDLEIYNLMVEIESSERMDPSALAELDYLWGSAAQRIRSDLVSNSMSKTTGEQRKIQFRDNLPIDPRFCAATVLYFPFERAACHRPLSFDKVRQHEIRNELEANYAEQCYDPVFILRFSIHSLSMDYLDPVEFAGLGLLAIALISISSPDEGIRKLAYEVLGRFKDVLEKSQRKREVMRLRLLLTYVQNGIEEPWQKIPAIIAVFVAEASVILLDSSSDRYAAVSKLLMEYPRMNLKGIPLFPDLFWSSSLNLKTDRLWMLRLLYTGINLADDAQIYMKNSVLEMLLSFYVSPLSDNESKELILQILQKVVKLQKITCFLVESCGLIPWISSILSSSLNLGEDQDVIFRKQCIISLQVMNKVISLRGSAKWLQKSGLEQLSDLAANMLNILVSGSKLVERDVSFVISILELVVSALKWSQKRKIYQPHFTLSLRVIYKLYQAVDRDNYAKYCQCAEIALQTILMSSPPVAIFQLDQEELSKFLGWAVCIALKSDSALVLRPSQSYPYFTAYVTEDTSEDSLLSKLLRWLIASVILGRISSKKNDFCSCFSLVKPTSDTLLSLVECFQKNCGVSQSASGSDEILAAVIFYLQQLLGVNNKKVLSSIVAALSLLLLADGFSPEGSVSIFSYGSPVSLLLSKIRCPLETHPAWRWSYYQPWVDLSSEQTALENMEESHACQTVLVILLEVLSKKLPDIQSLPYEYLINSGVFEWEKSVVESE